MNNASAKSPSAGLSPAAPSIFTAITTGPPKVYKTAHGQFWHYEAAGRRRSSYLITACGRRLGRWHLQPPRPTQAVAAEEICAGCIRKTTSP